MLTKAKNFHFIYEKILAIGDAKAITLAVALVHSRGGYIHALTMSVCIHS